MPSSQPFQSFPPLGVLQSCLDCQSPKRGRFGVGLSLPICSQVYLCFFAGKVMVGCMLNVILHTYIHSAYRRRAPNKSEAGNHKSVLGSLG